MKNSLNKSCVDDKTIKLLGINVLLIEILCRGYFSFNLELITLAIF